MQEDRGIEKLLLVLLFVITVTQFSGWGYQSVKYILSQMFSVNTNSTPVEMLIGFVAMIASALVFAGAAMWWKENPKAFTFLTKGSLLFVVKNILDMIDETWVFAITHNEVTMPQIESLAAELGQQFFQLAFWLFVFYYFSYKIKKSVARETPTTTPHSV